MAAVTFACSWVNAFQSSEDDWEHAPKAGVATSLTVQFLSTLVGAGHRESLWPPGSLCKRFTGLVLMRSHRLRSASAP